MLACKCAERFAEPISAACAVAVVGLQRGPNLRSIMEDLLQPNSARALATTNNLPSRLLGSWCRLVHGGSRGNKAHVENAFGHASACVGNSVQ